MAAYKSSHGADKARTHAKTHVLLFEAPVSIEARRAQGRAMRLTVPRESHAEWSPAGDRPDPVDIIIASNRGRVQDLLPIRHARMLTSSFAFLRGSAVVMALDLSRTPVTGIRVQACGDCHLMNFGGFATPERNLVFDINDFDETLPAPWEWDVKRLAASVAVAGRYIGLGNADCRRAAYEAVYSYCRHMNAYAEMPQLDVWYDKISIADLLKNIDDDAERKRVQGRIRAIAKKSVVDHYYPKMVEEDGGTPRIRDNPPLVYHHPDQKHPEFEAVIANALKLYRKSLPDHHRVLFDRYTIRDLAAKVVGVGSVGTACWVGLYTASGNDPLFLQIKEANPSVLEPYAGKSQVGNHGQRVVAGQRLMQSASDIFLGWTHGTLRDRHYYVRQLRDMKMSVTIEAMDLERLARYADFCGWALARAHAKSGDPVRIAGYLGGGKTFSTAVTKFAMAYADRTDADHRLMAQAVANGRISAAQ